MSNRNTLTRTLHDVGLSAWFGGSLMGAVGLNGATAKAADPKERLKLSSIGWARWTPVQVGAIGIHLVGAVAQIVGNRKRVASDPATQMNSIIKTGVTVAAMGVTAYSGLLGQKVAALSHEGGEGVTEPKPGASDKLASAQNQLRIMQWAIPALTGVLIFLTSQQGEQQRGIRGLLDS